MKFDGDTETDPDKIAERLNKFYIESITTLRDSIPDSNFNILDASNNVIQYSS